MAATAQRSASDTKPRPGLRERKKARTRTAIREATYRLVETGGYDATTVEQIAAAAEVSPSTVLRYFPTKEDIVLTDPHDPLLERELRQRPADEPWRDSLRHVLRTAITLGDTDDPDVSRLRTRLLTEVPAVRSRMRENASATGRLLGRALAERAGRDPDGLEDRVFATALTGALAETSLYWAETGHRDDPADLVDRTVGVLEHGPPTGKPDATTPPPMPS